MALYTTSVRIAMDMQLFTRVAGVSHYQSRVRRARVGQEVRLVHEPRNKHDPNAVAVKTAGIWSRRLGYIPRGDAPAFVDALKEHRIIKVTINSMGTPSNVPTIGLRLLVEFKSKPTGVTAALRESLNKAAEDVMGGSQDTSFYTPSQEGL